MIHRTQWRAHVKRVEDNIVLACNTVRDLGGGGGKEKWGDIKKRGKLTGGPKFSTPKG